MGVLPAALAARDGRFVGLLDPDQTSVSGRTATAEIHVIQNFFEELKRIAPR